MPHFAGLDIGKRSTSICVLDKSGVVVCEGEVATEPAAIIAFLRGKHRRYARVGFETVSVGPWLYERLAKAGLPAICIDARHAHGILKAKLNKTDHNDARGIAEIMRGGLYKAVHIKTVSSQRVRQSLVVRAFLRRKAQDAENLVRATLLQFGLKLAPGRRTTFEKNALAVVGRDEMARSLVAPLLAIRAAMYEQIRSLDKSFERLADADPACRRFMTVPGVAALTALAFRASVDVPERFTRSRLVGVHLGMTPRLYESGETRRRGGISRCGDRSVRSYLYLSARSILRKRTRATALQTWGNQVASRRGYRKAVIAVARKLASVLHRMWVTETDFLPLGAVA